jgi:hypothetical protein
MSGPPGGSTRATLQCWGRLRLQKVCDTRGRAPGRHALHVSWALTV